MNKVMTKKELQSTVEPKRIALRSDLLMTLPLLLVGTAPLIVNNWDEKALAQMRDKQQKQARGAREAKNPEANFEAAKYRSVDGWEGVPAHGLKGAFTEGARFIAGSKDLNMTLLKGALRVIADCQRTNLLRLYASTPAVMREDKVRVGTGASKTTDLRYRPEDRPWFLRVRVQFPSAMFSAEQISDLIRAAGAFNGFCEWRPGSPISRTGTYGTFEIGDQDQVDAFETEFKVSIQ